jgi:hypothetical protein
MANVDIFQFSCDTTNDNVPSTQRKGATVDQGMRFIKYNITRVHRNVHCLSLSVVDFQRPRLVHVLSDIYNTRSHQGVAIHVRRKNGS